MDDIQRLPPTGVSRVAPYDTAKLLSLALDQTSEGIAVVDLHGDLFYVNHAFAGMHGYTPDELAGKNLAIFHSVEQMSVVGEANRQVRETGEFKGEVWHVRRDGRAFPTFMHSTLIRDDDGRPIGMLGTMRDVSDMHRIEASLAESERKFAVGFMASPAILVISSIEEGRYIEVNRAFEQLTGYARQEVVGLTSKELQLWAVAEQRDMLLEKLKRQGFIENEEIGISTRKGEMLTGLVSSVVIGIKGAPCLLSQIIDITEQKRMEQEMRDAARHLQQRVHDRTEELALKTRALEDMNTTLRVLLERGKKDTAEVEERVTSNIESMVLPFLRKIHSQNLDAEQKANLAAAESALTSITSSFTRRLSSRMVGLSPTEIQVANLVRLGYTTKEIASALGVSAKTTDVHRLNIRKKLGIAGEKTSLRKYLLVQMER